MRLSHLDKSFTPLVCFDGEGGGGAGAGAGSGSGGGAGAGSGEEKKFTQADVDRLISERLDRDRRANPRQTQEEREELERLRNAERQREQDEAEKRKEYDRAVQSIKQTHQEELGKKDKTLESLTGELRTERITNAIVRAASPRAINAIQVAQLLSNRVKLDARTLQPVVLDENGDPALKNGQPVPIEALVNGFLDQNKHFVKPDDAGQSRGTAGSGGAGAGGAETESGELDKLKKVYEAALEDAKKNGTPSNIVKAEKARKAYEAAKQKKTAA